ncbi:TPA: hypothetical protein HA241_02770 [Candidatus Woesearchaeota archaeon]|nr:hypothetical protein [Candidatus Woesearchaeota archaeon]
MIIKNKKKDLARELPVDLEAAIKEKVIPALEETMEKSLGIRIPQIETDITDQLKKPQLEMYVPRDARFEEAKKIFRNEFLKTELKIHLGNVSQLAKTLGLDRRSVHRAIKESEIDMEEIRGQDFSAEQYQQGIIHQMIKTTLDQYKDIFQPQKMEKIYEEVPSLSRTIAQILPHQDWELKDAEQEFERQFLLRVLEENEFNVLKTATKIGLRAETLHRKIKKLRLKG